jgi:hypothetical protein
MVRGVAQSDEQVERPPQTARQLDLGQHLQPCPRLAADVRRTDGTRMSNLLGRGGET